MASWRSYLLTMVDTIVFTTKNLSQTYEREKTAKRVKDGWLRYPVTNSKTGGG
jgi:hypothetical protein